MSDDHCDQGPDVDDRQEWVSLEVRSSDVNDQSDVDNNDSPGCVRQAGVWSSEFCGLQVVSDAEDVGGHDPTGVEGVAYS